MSLPAATSPAPPAPAPVPTGSRRPGYAPASWRALGTYVNLVVADAPRLAAAEAEAVAVLAAVDRACSRFRPDSDLVRANQQAGRWVRVDPLLTTAMRAALDAAAQTDGLVDPTLGLNLAAIGYDRDLAELGADGPAAVPVPVVPDGWRLVEVAEDALRVPVGVALDLGSTGKAFAADLIAERVPERAGTDLIISLGGDVAVGMLAPDAEPHPWQVAISELPDQPPAQTVLLERGGLATSGVLNRRWRRGGQVQHHLLDPRTGRPVRQCWRTVSVAAADCLAANIASTASIVMGTTAPAWLAERGLPARLVSDRGQVVRVSGWPEEGE